MGVGESVGNWAGQDGVIDLNDGEGGRRKQIGKEDATQYLSFDRALVQEEEGGTPSTLGRSLWCGRKWSEGARGDGSSPYCSFLP